MPGSLYSDCGAGCDTAQAALTTARASGEFRLVFDWIRDRVFKLRIILGLIGVILIRVGNFNTLAVLCDSSI